MFIKKYKKEKMAKENTRSDKSTYNAQYPMNQVWETPSGHQLQVDNTPGHERIFIRHSSGTFMEMSADGKVQTFTVGDSKTTNKAGVTLTIDENNDVKISGHNRLMCSGGAHIEVAGDAGIAVGGAVALVGMGPVNIRAKSAYLGTDGDLNINAGGGINMKAAGNVTVRGANIFLN
jgi:hypothetical protein